METAWRAYTTVVLWALLALSLLAPGSGAASQTFEKHAGLVVQFGDGSTQTYCVAFEGESISGLDLLLKTGLEVRVESFGGTGSMICKIGPDGCDYPEQPCVCQSYGPEGVYWSYHHLREGAWRTSGVGLSSYRVRDGEVEGLAWSAGKPPPIHTFSQVCSEVRVEAPQPVATQPPPTFTPEPPQEVPTKEPNVLRPTAAATLQPTRVATPTRQPSTTRTGTTPPSPTTRLPVTSTSTSVVEATATLTPVDTATSIPTNTAPPPTATPIETPQATATTLGPTPTTIPAAEAPASGEETARNIGLAIGAAAIVGLAGWLAWRRRGGTGPDVE